MYLFDLDKLFASIDNKDTEAFCNFLHHECSFRFSNSPTLLGIDNIAEYIEGFFDSIKALEHKLVDSRRMQDQIIAHGEVTYTRKDDTQLTVQFANILTLSGSLDEAGKPKLIEYLIFADTSKLYKH